jgi:hypothetical protein
MVMKNLILILVFTLFISPKVWGNDFDNFDLGSLYDLSIIHGDYNDHFESQQCVKSEQSFAFNTSMSLSHKNDCFTDGFHEQSFMFNYHVNKRHENLALTYNTLSIGVAIDTKKIDLGNGQEVTVYKPRVKADFSGDIDPGYFFTQWKLTLNSTSIQKLQERNLPSDPMMRSMVRDNLFRHNIDGSSLKGRVILLELQLSFGG